MATTADNLYRYKLYCETEDTDVITVLQHTGTPAAPTACPNDPAHTIVHAATRLVHVTYADEMRMFTGETSFSNGHYLAVTEEMEIKHTDSEVIKLVNFPLNLSLFAVQFRVENQHLGDRVEMTYAPDSNLGPISNNLSPGDNKITLTTGQLAYLNRGYVVKVQSGATQNNLGRILNIDWKNLQIQTEQTCTDSFSLGVTNILFEISLGQPTLTIPQTFVLGDVTGRASKILPGTNIQFKYFNQTGGNKRISLLFQFTY